MPLLHSHKITCKGTVGHKQCQSYNRIMAVFAGHLCGFMLLPLERQGAVALHELLCCTNVYPLQTASSVKQSVAAEHIYDTELSVLEAL